MAKSKGASGDGREMASETTLHQKGMQTRMPSATDASTRVKGGSVNKDATRSSVAKSHSISGRVA